MKKVIFSLISVLLGVVLSIIVSEIIVRMTGLAPDIISMDVGNFRINENPKIVYELVPDYSQRGLKEEKAMANLGYISDQSNHLGFRDHNHPLKKDPNSFRIIVLGDSITHGQFIKDYRKIFTGRMEDELHNVEVLNFGVSGYNTLQEVEILKTKGLEYRPDIVIVAYCLNDNAGMERHMFMTLYFRMLELQGKNAVNSGSSKKRVSTLLSAFALYRFFKYRIFRTGDGDISVDGRISRQSRLITKNQYIKMKNTEDRSFRALANMSKKYGFKAIIVIFPYLEDYSSYGHIGMHNRIKSLASKYSIPVLDLLHAFRKCTHNGSDLKAKSTDNTHPNEYGHDCAAKAIVTYLRENNILPAKYINQ